MGELYTTMQVQRAGDQVFQKLRDVARPGRITHAIVLDPEPNRGRRVDVWLHSGIETDLFGERARCLFRDRMLDLITERVLAYRSKTAVYTPRDRYFVRHVPTGVPVNIYVARTDEDWQALLP